MRLLKTVVLTCPILLSTALAQARIASINFYGYEGASVDDLRRKLPFQAGDAFPQSEADKAQWKQQATKALQAATGRLPVGVNFVCCFDQNGVVYIGLAGSLSKPFTVHAAPLGKVRLSRNIVDLEAQISEAIRKGIEQGDAKPDNSAGYAIYPAARELQVKLRSAVQQDRRQFLDVLASSADASHRAMAAEALPMGAQDATLIAALTEASFDAAVEVRDNALRALVVMVQADPGFAGRVPVARFLPLLFSHEWEDRNKGSFLFEALTRHEDPAILTQLREEALEPLVEMARWPSGHAYAARVILGRIADIDEGLMEGYLLFDDAESILRAVEEQTRR